MKKFKKSSDYSYSIGVYPTIELLENRIGNVIRVMISSKGDRNEGVSKIEEICRSKAIKIEVADGAINKLARSENAYAIGVFNKYEAPLGSGNHLVLVNPSDAGNLGTIIRNLVAFDMPNLAVVGPGVSVFDPKVIRASMGAVFKINFKYFETMVKYREKFSNNLFPFTTDGEVSLPQMNFIEPYSLVFGNEGAGLPKDYNKLGRSVKIPQSGKVDSLNLAVSVGIALYEVKNRN